MGKRTKSEPRAHDAWDTPLEVADALRPWLGGIRTFAEPCVGNWHLAKHLQSYGLDCAYADDIKTGADALQTEYFGPVDAIITNPPWTRSVLHPMILHFQRFCPTWLVFQADWMHTRQAALFLKHCSHIVSVGRVRWIPGSAHDGFENVAWYRFHAQHIGETHFIGQPQPASKEARAA